MDIFTQSPNLPYWLSGTNHNLVHDLETWRQGSRPKCSVIEILDYDDRTHDLVNHCLAHGSKTVLLMPEMISDDWCQEFDLPNVLFMINGRLNWQPRHAQVGDFMYFFWSTCDFYRAYPDLLNNLDGNKTQMFDVLLGRRKTHRDMIFHGIDKIRNVVTYFPTMMDQDLRSYDAAQFQWPQEVLAMPDREVKFTVEAVLVDGVIVSLSQIIPREIYSRTRYSLVAETKADNDFSFFTEKIVKPMLAKRLFLVASGQYYLRNLRDFGFQTFHGIIDESYDYEPDLEKRMSMVLEQTRLLSGMDPDTVAKQIQPILDHNYFLMTQISWQSNMIQRLLAFLE